MCAVSVGISISIYIGAGTLNTFSLPTSQFIVYTTALTTPSNKTSPTSFPSIYVNVYEYVQRQHNQTTAHIQQNTVY